MSCEHKDFVAVVVVQRMEDTKAFFAEIRVKCAQCDLPFEFIGVKAGLSGAEPRCSLDAQELTAPIRPKGSKVFPAVQGFDVKAN